MSSAPASVKTRVVPLSSLRCGQRGVICRVAADCDSSVCHRLQLLGFSEGRAISKVRQAPLGGPMIFRVCDVQMCLRQAHADLVLVELADEPEFAA